MMWRTASLYVIGKQLNRSIYFDGNYKCIYEYKEEFRDIFENNYKIFKIMRPKKQHVKLVSFAEKCCHYDSPDRLTDESAQLIKIWGNYLQSFKYLRNYKKQIRKFFTFSTQNKLKAYQFAQNCSKFKICVHTRRGDFVELQQSTNKYFTEKATSYIINSVKKRYSNISIILFGDDNNFLNHIEIADNVTIYTPTIRSRAVNLCFAINYCNSLLITAPTSTFAWWMGYLLPEGSPIFYYSCERSCRHISKKDFFPTEWLPLTLNFEGKIEVDDNPF
uniref:Uncharacterized protein n=1 Tax=Meloidogyne enterolobii TaxID=390850 RepID=A0A6V7Y5F3_MELEN|nr:unnamed protein product [Meloidogyne enterolobii]